MVSAIGSFSTHVAAATSVASTAGIEAQIARDQKELSNCVNCASAETKQGQVDIQALSNKINIAKARLEQITASSPNSQTAEVNQTTAAETRVSETAANSIATASTLQTTNDSDTTLPAPDPGVGRFVDEYV